MKDVDSVLVGVVGGGDDVLECFEDGGSRF